MYSNNEKTDMILILMANVIKMLLLLRVCTIDIFSKTLHFFTISLNQANDIYVKIYKKTACDVTRKRETSKLVYIFRKYQIRCFNHSYRRLKIVR
jgi:hypothetical protein